MPPKSLCFTSLVPTASSASRRWPLHQQADGTGVANNGGVGGKQCECFELGLGDQESVEGVVMDRWQQVYRSSMGGGDRKLLVAVLAQPPEVDVEIGSAQAAFDGHLPDRHGAEGQLCVGVLDQGADIFGQALGDARGPKQHVGVEQKAHSCFLNSASISGLPIWSKSAGTEMPGKNLVRLIAPGAGASRGTTFTSGLPARAMTKGSPWTAPSTSF